MYAMPMKTRNVAEKLRVNITALATSHVIREHAGITLCDLNQLRALYNEIITGRAAMAQAMKESEIFITNTMRPILEVSGFPLGIHCGQYFINWKALT